jgi:hypothetical protein
MINKSKSIRFLSLAMLAAALLFVSGHFSGASAQRDPFEKPGWAKTREPRTGMSGAVKKGTGVIENFGAPAIEQRIEYYKRLREDSVANGQPVPKVTSVLTLNELAVTGIFKTPRGYAAMVEAVPIKLSYTVYPGDKFFDGQLVAVEENRVVFRKVTKVGTGKFVSSVENKSLRKYTDRETIQGTAPTESEAKSDAPANGQPTAIQGDKKVASVPVVVSPLTEMDKQAKDAPSTAKSGKDAKKPVKVAKKKQ